jgi:cytochrome bd-type quinol oxidase subunit 2
MKTKIKKIAYGAISATVLLPSLVFAQWTTGLNNADTSALPGGTLTGIITQAMNWILALVGIIGVIGFAIAGILYLTAAGDETRIEKAKKAMLMSIVGVVVALVGLVIIRAVNTWLGGTESSF